MNTLRVHSQTITLVDQVEDRLLNYLKEKDIRTGRRRTTSLVGCRIKYFRDKSECHHIHVHPCKSLFFRLELHACKRRHLNGCSTHIISVYSILSQIECYNCIRIFRTAIQLFNSNTLQFSFYLISGWSHGDCLILTSYSLKCCYRL